MLQLFKSMSTTVKLSTLFFILTEIFIGIGGSRELVQIHTLTRHGERSPCSSYPSDPYRHLWTRGLGQLTDKGIFQLKEVGYYFRNHYRDFLPTNFHKNDFYIKSSDMDRTIMSAYAAMSTLFDNEIVPVHMVPESEDFLLKMSSNCPLHKKLLIEEYKLEKYQKIISEYSNFFKGLEKGTGLQNIDIRQALKICGAITVWAKFNLTLSNWVNSQSVTNCIELGNLKFIIAYTNKALTTFRGGPLFNYMVDNMVKRAQLFVGDKSGIKMFGLFAHDNIIGGLLGHLGSFNPVKAPLASTVIAELFHDSHSTIIDNDILSQFSVRFLFKNDTLSPPHILNVTICNDGTDIPQQYCRLDTLHKYRRPHSLEDMPRECGLIENINNCSTSDDHIKLNQRPLEKQNTKAKPEIAKTKYKSDL